MAEMSDVIKKPPPREKDWLMGEAKQLENKRDGEQAPENGSAHPQKPPR